MLKKLFEPFVWVIGVVAGTAFLVVSFVTASELNTDLIRRGDPYDVACLGLSVANIFAFAWIVLYFGARRFTTAWGTLYWSLLTSWVVAGAMDVAVFLQFKNITSMFFGKYEITLWTGYAAAVVVANLYAVTRVYRYSRIAKAAALAEDKHPFAGWDSKPMIVVAALILICGVAVILGMFEAD